jgi:hypothetical protein
MKLKRLKEHGIFCNPRMSARLIEKGALFFAGE